ncbi:MAG: four helix bundle protein [Symploca sp. SIO2C1]|nr:four helix bundle protein [Symploca sp. SIO2C1]
MGDNISIQERTELFAIRVVKTYVELNKKHFDDASKVLSKQLLRAGTSIGANCAEAEFAQSHKDFISKYSIALKEASECRYWIKILVNSGTVPKQKFTAMQSELDTIIRILISSINTLKQKAQSPP